VPERCIINVLPAVPQKTDVPNELHTYILASAKYHIILYFKNALWHDNDPLGAKKLAKR
jgi:hypothetical protein